MKYIKKLNIDFNDWDNIDDNNIKFIAFRTANCCNFIGYIIYKNSDYHLKLIESDILLTLNPIGEIKKLTDKTIFFIHDKDNLTISYKEINTYKVSFIGINLSKEYFLKNLNKFVIEDNNYTKKDISL